MVEIPKSRYRELIAIVQVCWNKMPVSYLREFWYNIARTTAEIIEKDRESKY